MAEVRHAVKRVEERLEADPFSYRLGTKAFITEQLGGVSATPARLDDWYLLWQRGAEQDVIEILLVHQIRI